MLLSRTSDYGEVVHRAGAPLHDHVWEFRHFYLGVIALLHQVHDGEGGALRHHAPPLAVAEVASGLLAASCAPEGLVASRFDDPVLRPGEGTEVDEVLLTAAGVFVLADVTVASRTEEGGGGDRRVKLVDPENLSYTPGLFMSRYWLKLVHLCGFNNPKLRW